MHQNDTEAPGARLHGWEAALASVKEIPVLIVGGGTIGMALGTKLLYQGIECLVIE